MKGPTKQERRKLTRRNLSYYLAITDSNSGQVLGHLVNISSKGLMIDSKKPLPSDLDFNLRLDLMEDIADKPSVEFVARTRWCRADAIQPFLHNVGLEIISISPEDAEIIQRVADRYSARQAMP